MSQIGKLVKYLLPNEIRPHRIFSGAMRGVKLELNLARQTQIWLGLSERETHRWLKIFTRDLKSAVDVGAAEGEYGIYFLMKTPAEIVITFDPDSENEERFDANLMLNRCLADSRLIRLRKFVGQRREPEWCRLDEFASVLKGPCFVKIDVDGGEVDVLESGVGLLEKMEVRFLVETHSIELERDCCAFLRGRGFDVHIIPNAWWRLFVPERRPIAHNRWLFAHKA
jgi:hypothetical protein